MSDKNLYDENYYKYHLGLEYNRKEIHWQRFFCNIADRIIKEFNPKTVLDVGCAKGFLVEALRDRGVEAFGIDISEHAISQVREDIKPYCKVASILEPLNREYDLIITIEVLEHLTEDEGKRAIENLCNHTQHVIFSSTPDDIEEFTHINVRPIDYWVKLFAQNNFVRDLEHDMSYISPQAIKLDKINTNFINLVQTYDREYNRLKNENKIIRRANIVLNKKVDDLTNKISKQFVSKLYIDNGKGYDEKNCIITNYDINYKEINYDLEGIYAIHSLRWDPVENKFCKLKIYDVKLIYENDFQNVDLKSLKHNGVQVNEEIIFYTVDPQVFIGNANFSNIRSIKIKADIEELDGNLIEKKIQDLELNIKLLQNNITIKEELNKKNEEKLSELNDSILLIKQAKEKQDEDIQHLIAEKRLLDKQLTQLRKNLYDYKMKLSNTETKLEIYEKLNNELKGDIKRKMEENKELNKKVILLEKDKESITEKLKIEIKRLNDTINGLNIRINQLEIENRKLNNILEEVLKSDSWRITKPLRFIGQSLKKIFRKKVGTISMTEEIVLVNDNPNIAMHIDEYRVTGNINKQLIIKGWAFSQSGEKIKIEVISPKNKQIQINFHNREDVFRAFDCKFENALNSGFVFKIEKLKAKDIVTFRIGSGTGNSYKEYNVSIGKILKNYKRRKITRYRELLTVSNFKKAISYCRRYGIKNTLNKIRYKLKGYSNEGYNHQEAYQKWILNNENYNTNEVLKEIKNFKYKPKISIIMPVYNVEEKWIRKCIESVINQYYENWELCIADDNSTKTHIKPLLKEYMEKDNRIKVIFRQKNGHISRASNSALKIATGEFIALLDNDDELAPFALYEVVKLLNKYPDADLIYSDEDKIDEKGNRKDPHFKPDWSPDTLLSSNYICHLGVYRKSIIDKIGGFRPGYEGSQDYDLVLRFTEQTDKIYHIPKILYHWRMIEGSTALDNSSKNYAYEAGFRVLEDTIRRRKYDAKVYEANGVPYYNVVFNYKDNDFISIIIPTRDKADILEKCLKSIYEKTTFKNFEIIVVDNGSSEEKTFSLFDKYKKNRNFKVLRLDIPFNYSILNNKAVKKAKGNLLLFLNNDIEVITPNWLDIMAGQARREEIGAVGAKLLYPNNKVQHAGVILGVGGVANHAFLMNNRNDIGYFARLKVNYNYSAVTGACLMTKRSVFEEVKGFEESLAVAFNDIDFCLKILKRGYYNILLPDVELYHYESISRGKEDNPDKIRRFNKEIQYMMDKWGNILNCDPFYNPNFSLDSPHFLINFKESIEYKL